MSALDKLVKRCNEMDITEQLNWIGDAILPMDAKKELLALHAELADAKARAAAAEKGWHANEARMGKLQMVMDALAEIVKYDIGDASHGLQSLAKERLAEYEKLKGAA